MMESFLDWKHKINAGKTTNGAMYRKIGRINGRRTSDGDYIYDPDMPVDEDAPDEFEDVMWTDEFGRSWSEEYDEYGNSLIYVVHRLEDYIYTGKQFCPNCFVEIPKKDGYFECPRCGWSIDIRDAEVGEGCPTMAAAQDYTEFDNYADIFEVDPNDHF